MFLSSSEEEDFSVLEKKIVIHSGFVVSVNMQALEDLKDTKLEDS